MLVGESPPFTPEDSGEELRYIYNSKHVAGSQILLSNLSYAFLGRKVMSAADEKLDILMQLRDKGVFLVDATYEPINTIKDRRTRHNKIRSDYPELRRRIQLLPLEKRIDLILIHRNVIVAIGEVLRADFECDNCRIHDIAFPRCNHDPRFRDRIRELTDDWS